MAKLKAPLFSFGASGQLAKSLVYFPWKGINSVREYVVPANPKSTAQLAQRAHMTAAVAEYHGAEYTEDDMTAWSRLAGIGAAIMSGFNRMVKSFVDEIILGNAWERIHDTSTDTVTTTQFGVGCWKVAAGNAPTVHIGTRKTHMPESFVMTDGGDGTWHAWITGRIANTLYYFYIDAGSSGTDYGRTGIYQQRTPAA